MSAKSAYLGSLVKAAVANVTLPKGIQHNDTHHNDIEFNVPNGTARITNVSNCLTTNIYS